MSANNSRADIRAQHNSIGDLYLPLLFSIYIFHSEDAEWMGCEYCFDCRVSGLWSFHRSEFSQWKQLYTLFLTIWLTLHLQHLQQQFPKTTAGIFPHCEKTNLLFKRSLKSFAIVKATQDGLVWSPPISLQKVLPSEPSKAVLDWLLCLQLQRASSDFLWSVL